MIQMSAYVPLLNTIDSIQRKAGKNYCYPMQITLSSLVQKYHNVKMSLRTLNRYLRRLEDEGYITRKRRTKKNPDGTTSFTSTLYTLTHKAYNYLGSLVRKLTHYTKNIFKRPPQKESPGIPSWMPGPDEGRILAREEVSALARGLLKEMG